MSLKGKLAPRGPSKSSCPPSCCRQKTLEVHSEKADNVLINGEHLWAIYCGEVLGKLIDPAQVHVIERYA